MNEIEVLEATSRPTSRPVIRWIEHAQIFLVDWGNIHFAVTPEAAAILGADLREAAATI